MVTRTLLQSNSYFDSVTLMRISGQVNELSGITDVLVGMGTDLNKDSLSNVGLLTDEAKNASPNDLMIGINADSEEALATAFNKIEELLTAKNQSSSQNSEMKYRTIEQACKLNPGYNIAVISTPGTYSAREAKNALNQNMHVFLFSDNVTKEEEIELKTLALEKGLLMMGPDCGTAIINGVPLGFANRVRKGDIGIVGASGTGLQHVTTLIEYLGEGITQAIGTGGRDLSLQVGGKTMLAALDALKEDEDTKVVVIISKPPAQEVAEKVLAKAKNMGKPVVLCLLGSDTTENIEGSFIQCNNIEDAAVNAVQLLKGQVPPLPESNVDLVSLKALLGAQQKYVRGLFGGGTLCDEALMVFRSQQIPFFSNAVEGEQALIDVEKSEGNTFLDLGDDYFTRGKPHPMIEPSLRNSRLVKEALDPETAIILVDVVLGHGSHNDPAGIVVDGIQKAQKQLKDLNRKVVFIASLIGTMGDPQGMTKQRQKLEEAGVVVLESNVRAATLAAKLVQSQQGKAGD
jgi:FdrA protein